MKLTASLQAALLDALVPPAPALADSSASSIGGEHSQGGNDSAAATDGAGAAGPASQGQARSRQQREQRRERIRAALALLPRLHAAPGARPRLLGGCDGLRSRPSGLGTASRTSMAYGCSTMRPRSARPPRRTASPSARAAPHRAGLVRSTFWRGLRSAGTRESAWGVGIAPACRLPQPRNECRVRRHGRGAGGGHGGRRDSRRRRDRSAPP